MIAPGCRVRLAGLISRPELNGKEATVLGWIAENERWAVRLVQASADGMIPT